MSEEPTVRIEFHTNDDFSCVQKSGFCLAESSLNTAYDCSGAVSYALYGARLLLAPLDSSGLAEFGEPGPGRWVTIYANKSHVFVMVAGLRFDTGGHRGAIPAGTGPRWSTEVRATRRFAVRHPEGL